MSQYIQFFARSPKGEYIELAAYSRSNQIYQYANAPYARIKRVNEVFFKDIVALIRHHIDFVEQQIKKNRDMIASIERFSNIGMDERLQRIYELQDNIEDYEEEIDSCERDINDMWFMNNMLDDCEIYAGIEIGDPTDADRADEISDN